MIQLTHGKTLNNIQKEQTIVIHTFWKTTIQHAKPDNYYTLDSGKRPIITTTKIPAITYFY